MRALLRSCGVGQCAMRDGGRLAVAVWAHASMMMQRVPLRHAHHAPVAPGGYTSCVSRKHVRGHAQPRTHGGRASAGFGTSQLQQPPSRFSSLPSCIYNNDKLAVAVVSSVACRWDDSKEVREYSPHAQARERGRRIMGGGRAGHITAPHAPGHQPSQASRASRNPHATALLRACA